MKRFAKYRYQRLGFYLQGFNGVLGVGCFELIILISCERLVKLWWNVVGMLGW